MRRKGVTEDKIGVGNSIMDPWLTRYHKESQVNNMDQHLTRNNHHQTFQIA